ncbi:MAG: pyruvate, phosphate dikinase [Clostridiales bacterium]|nr:pyruvate, phosphate dikinase [Clostridiales bacterium]
MAKKYVYLFSEGNANQRELLGGKGANLAEMTNLGLPVPEGFTICTDACNSYYENNESLTEGILGEIDNALESLEKQTGKKLGGDNPLFVSVRSGARVSMPGMMDTILNLGLNDKTVEILAKQSNNSRFAYDSYRRFVQMFSNVAMGMNLRDFESVIDKLKESKGYTKDSDLTCEDLKAILSKFKEIYKSNKGEDFPQDTKVQLLEAVKAVFRTWNNPRAIVYRRMNDIPASWGTAVNVQRMVFGNLGETSGTGVAFSRNPSTGENVLYGEYLMNAQGEDIVAGVRTPNPISQLKEQLPDVYKQYTDIVSKLEKHYKDMQDMEFTIENGKLYMLQTRNGKRTAAAAIKIAVDLVNEGLNTEKEALMKIEVRTLDTLLHNQLDSKVLKNITPIATGLPASPGAGVGKIAFTSERAVEMAKNGDKVILVRLETSAEDIEGMHNSQGIITCRGGMTSHAAVVARGLGTPCVAGVSNITINDENTQVEMSGKIYKEGDVVSIDGATGNVYDGAVPTTSPELNEDFKTVMGWAKKYKKLGVRANADTPKDAKTAFDFGAEGIGLVRTEHMFFDADRILPMRKMIVSTTEEDRVKALNELLPMQREDFVKLFVAMNGNPVTIRYLDPPLHEFLPKTEKDEIDLAAATNVSLDKLREIMNSLHEFNPMMGHRGCRLSITYPEIAKMQTRAVIEAAIKVCKDGINVKPEIMIPLVCSKNELEYVKNIVDETAKEVMKEQNYSLDYLVGTMIEIPRAAVLADSIAEAAEFFSFGTNDLTQMTYGFSRDDAGKFLNEYYDKKVFEQDPFVRVDEDGVGALVKMGVEKGRKTKPNLKTGICGEHGGEPSSIEFFHKAGLSYVSCSPYRIPIAILASAQAAIKND